MKKISTIITLLVLFTHATFASDFTDKLLLYWSFNNPETAPSFFSNSISTRGYAGRSLEMKGKPMSIELNEKLRLQKRFSVNFWFKPQDSETKQSIVTLKGDTYSEIEFGLNNQTIYCVVNGHTINHYPFMILSNDWSMVSLSYDGQSFHLTLFSSAVTSTSHFAISEFKTPTINTIELASPGKGYSGLFDELMIYGKETKATDLEKLYEGTLPQEQPLALVASKNTHKTEENKLLTQATTVASPTTSVSKRANFFAGETVVNKPSLILEVRNWKDIDQKFNILVNGKLALDGEKDPTGISLIELDTDESNALTFTSATGEMPSEQIEFKLWDGAKVIKSFNISFPSQTETLYNITHRSEGKSITEVQRTLQVQSRKISIEVWDDKLPDGDFVSIYHNETKVLDYQEITKEKIRIELTIRSEGANIIAFVSEDSGKVGNNSAKVRIYENGKLVDEFRFTSTYRKVAGLLIQLKDKPNQ